MSLRIVRSAWSDLLKISIRLLVLRRVERMRRREHGHAPRPIDFGADH